MYSMLPPGTDLSTPGKNSLKKYTIIRGIAGRLLTYDDDVTVCHELC
jgi:hypothetical protein